MKRTSFYILAAIVGILEVVAFWISVEQHDPLLIIFAFIAGIVLLYIARRTIHDIVEDERTRLINEKAMVRTFQVFWVIFFAISLGDAVVGLGAPGFPRPPTPPPGGGIYVIVHAGHIGIVQMLLLFLMIILYVGFRFYYARQYGEWESDEEQD
jgi:uncharacterized membrane protein